LWQELIELCGCHNVTWQWVRGHSTDKNNNRCDELAVAARLNKIGRGP
jgi:ribonuclease HI